MTLVIQVPPEVERRLLEQAEKVGLGIDEYVNRLVAESVPPLPASGAELVARWREAGVIGAWTKRLEDNDSVTYAQTLRRKAESR